jgi:hypothetical protein
MGTAAAFLACYCSLRLSAPGKPSDPGISSEFLPAQPGIRQGASRRSHVLMRVDPRDALMQHFHACHLLKRPSPHPDTGTRRPPGPRSVQETDIRSRRCSGGYPARGPGPNLSYGHDRSKGVRTRRAARNNDNAPSSPPAATSAPGKPRPAPSPQHAYGGRDPVFIRHGRTTKRSMEFFLETGRTRASVVAAAGAGDPPRPPGTGPLAEDPGPGTAADPRR